jgi:multidrug resistance protein MdtO
MQAMTTAAPVLDAAERTRSWLDLLRAELAPTPGRFNATVRIVVATAIVLVTSLALEVPFVDLSAFIVIYLTMMTGGVTTQNSVFVAIVSALAIVVVTLSIALTILIFRFTIDYPPLRLGAMALVCFIGMYVSRILPHAVGFLLALIVFVTQAYVDVFPGGEAAIRAALWVWVAVVYAAAVTVAVNLVLLPADPAPLLRREVAERLRAVARAITAARGGRAQPAVARAFRATGVSAASQAAAAHECAIRGQATDAERTAKILLLGVSSQRRRC